MKTMSKSRTASGDPGLSWFAFAQSNSFNSTKNTKTKQRLKKRTLKKSHNCTLLATWHNFSQFHDIWLKTQRLFALFSGLNWTKLVFTGCCVAERVKKELAAAESKWRECWILLGRGETHEAVESSAPAPIKGQTWGPTGVLILTPGTSSTCARGWLFHTMVTFSPEWAHRPGWHAGVCVCAPLAGKQPGSSFRLRIN